MGHLIIGLLSRDRCEILLKNYSPVPLYDFHPFLNSVFSAIGTSWLNTDEESCLDEGKCQRGNSQRKQEEVI